MMDECDDVTVAGGMMMKKPRIVHVSEAGEWWRIEVQQGDQRVVLAQSESLIEALDEAIAMNLHLIADLEHAIAGCRRAQR